MSNIVEKKLNTQAENMDGVYISSINFWENLVEISGCRVGIGILRPGKARRSVKYY